MSTHSKRSLRDKLRSTALWVKAIVLGSVGAVPILTSSLSRVYAAPTLPNRSATVTTTKTSTAFNITFRFDLPAAFSNTIQSVEVEFCDAPLGTCNTTQTPTVTGSSFGSQSGWDQATSFGTYTVGNGDNGGTNNQVQITRTEAGAEANPATDRVLTFNGLTNQADANESYYPRIRLYSDTAYTTLVAEGAVAQSTANQITVNARVQERLDFCVAATDINDATTNQSGGSATADDCTDITGNGLGTTVDIGVIDTNFSNVSPVATNNGGNNRNGIAMIRTNAFNGAVIDYFAEQNTSSGRLKVAGASCTADGSGFDTGSSNTDQCFDVSGTTATTIAAGTEEFGMTVAAVNCGSTAGYTCNFATGTYNLVRDAEYDGNGANTYVTDTDQVAGTTNGAYAWDQSGTIDRIASSAGSSVKVIDDEALILKFAATAGVTTPTGQYSVTSTYIATATF